MIWAKWEAVTKERDALRERMDVALSALHEYAIRERDAGEVGDSVASDALAEIAALASRATPQEPNDNANWYYFSIGLVVSFIVTFALGYISRRNK